MRLRDDRVAAASLWNQQVDNPIKAGDVAIEAGDVAAFS